MDAAHTRADTHHVDPTYVDGDDDLGPRPDPSAKHVAAIIAVIVVLILAAGLIG